ncbi:21834_t:CDS:2 [Rhizophagus irregularis]|nr:21834_t:CDS:2 [Rhizophagus irregularis]
MNGLKKLRQTLRRNGNKSRSNNKPLNEVYIYTPLPNHKNGYIIEFRHSDSSEIYYYKYKEIAGGTLTKYGYLTVADKEQIALEKRWMNELREKGKLHISAYDDDGEWSTLMQHNNDFIISDNIQRRRLDEILNKIDLNNNDIPTRTLPPLSIHQLSNNNNSSVKENVENGKKYQEEQQQPKEKVKKLIHLTQPKFRKTPMVYTYDPEDALEYKDCRCDYCLIDDYYE